MKDFIEHHSETFFEIPGSVFLFIFYALSIETYTREKWLYAAKFRGARDGSFKMF